MIKTLQQVADAVKAKGQKKVAVACGEDPHTIEAVGRAVKEGLIKAVLTGAEDNIVKVAREHQVDPDSFEIVNEPDKSKALAIAIERIRNKECDFLMKGLIDSSLYIRGILDKEKGLLTPGRVLSHVTVIQVPTWPKLILASDVAVIPYPDLDAKVAMINYSVDIAHKLGIDAPKVAIICAVEKVNMKMVPTTDAAILCKMAERGQIKGALVDGPLATDLAFSKESAVIKGVKSEVAGDADILIFPNIESGNVFFKTCAYLAKGELAAIVTGARCPCVLTSRSDSEDSKFYSIAIAALVS